MCAHAIIALIGVISEMNVGIYGVESLFLEFIRRDFGHESDAASLLVEVKHESFAFFFDQLHRFVELFPAIAAAAPENVARHATTVHAHQDRFARLPRSFEKRHVVESVALLFERNQAEIAVIRRHFDFLPAFHERFVLQTVGNQVFDGDNPQSFSRGKLF